MKIGLVEFFSCTDALKLFCICNEFTGIDYFVETILN